MWIAGLLRHFGHPVIVANPRALSAVTSSTVRPKARGGKHGRIARYNQLLRIEEELGSTAKYAGKKAFKVKF